MRRLGIALMALVIAGGAAAVFAWQQLGLAMIAPLDIDEPLELRVQGGANVNSVIEGLASDRLISGAFWPRAYVRMNPEMAQIKAGTYTIAPGTNLGELLGILVSGQADLDRVTLIEGWTAAQALEALLAHPGVVDDLDVSLQRRTDGVAYLPLAEQRRLSSALDIDAGFLEGWLFPDTYRFVDGTALSTLLTLAHERMQQQLERIWVSRADDLPLADPYALLTLASIVEKETGIESERSTIAGVFIRRLQKQMRLQTDPTVIYGIGIDYDGDIRRKDLNGDTAYNTYVIDALPPTPIALPGLASLVAVSQPKDGTVLFFVATGAGAGRHIFSTTNAEHEQAVAAFLKRAGHR
ncbi:MAG: endolytic transglycosylase MltG [Pseudomonadota bacterium]